MSVAARVTCPACGTALPPDVGLAGLCPRCLLGLAWTVAPARGDPAADSDLPTLPTPPTLRSDSPTALYAETTTQEGKTFTPGRLLGERYRIESLLGRGGMGEVWRAYDLKLRLEVALKSLHPRLFETEDALELLRDEVRAAREVTSPNVCRLYDLVEIEGQELVSMEYVDGVTLHEHLKQHGPLELKEANEIASQLLAGLETVHEAGLVHRDIKPENLMLTRAGRVVLMDFGLTSPSGSGSLGGTPAYMPPEQARGEATDARADVYSVGIVLAEMLSAERGPDESSRQSFWEAIREEPPVLPESPWKPILVRAISIDADARFASAAELALALEEVAFRVEGVEVEHPYPGLASFQEEDAEFFFGREAEVEAIWKRLQQVHLLGLMGPSGSGKSSFLNAGLLPAAPKGWHCVRMAPSTDPFAALGRALLPGIESDQEALDLVSSLQGLNPALELLREQRAKHGKLLIVVDQFEELFTQSALEVQQRFAELLGRAALEVDIHVLLSMRDDYLFQCQSFEILRPLFSELTPLGPPTGSSLRRAIVQPALRCGYRFEDDSIVEEMLQEVTTERAALPLIAFTAAQLWEKRDRETGYLTKGAYEAIGGVGGALAQHAESTLEQIGLEDIPVVRELFRNLVTADGTRASRDRDELLSVFLGSEGDVGEGHAGSAKIVGAGLAPSRGDERTEHVGSSGNVGAGLAPAREGARPSPTSTRKNAVGVLDALIDARLLTSYEIPDREGRPGHQRVEIVHESLLTAWPRLVRWQMKDAEGAKLRDELRAQAELWEQHGRTDDYLWTGAAYLDFLAWRERYPGGLTLLEEAYGEAMTRHAERRRRRRRIAATAAVVVLVGALAIVGGFWRRAVAEARRAEAAKLIAVAQLQFETDPSEALAYTTASLELADTEAARRLAQQILQEAPPAFEQVTGAESSHEVAFSPDGDRLATFGWAEDMQVFASAGGPPLVLSGHRSTTEGSHAVRWLSDDQLVTFHPTEGRARLWLLPRGELVRELEETGPAYWMVRDGDLLTEVFDIDEETGHELYHLRRWRMPDGEVEELGTVDMTALGFVGYNTWSWFDRHGDGWVFPQGNSLMVRPVPIREKALDRVVATHENPFRPVSNPPDESNGVWTIDRVTGDLRLWDLSKEGAGPLRSIGRPAGLEEGERVDLGSSGRWFRNVSRQVRLWSLDSWPGTRPSRLRRSGSWYGSSAEVHPSGDWLVATTQGGSRLTFWPLGRPMPRVVDGYKGSFRRPVAFSPDGSWLTTVANDGVQLWPMPGDRPAEVRNLRESDAYFTSLTSVFDPLGRFVCLVGASDSVKLVPSDGSPARILEGLAADSVSIAVAVSPSGRLIASAPYRQGPWKLKTWDLETGERRLFDLPVSDSTDKMGRAGAVGSIAFADESTLYSSGVGGVRRWDLESGTWELVLALQPGYVMEMEVAGDKRTAVVGELRLEDVAKKTYGPLRILDLGTGQVQSLPAFGEGSNSFVIDNTGTVVATSDADGVIQVGRISAERPHLLLGHEGAATNLAISPDGRWVASSGEDETLRLWPMPDLDNLPLHALPLDDLIVELRSLTNLRAVRDPESSTGWSIELGPFPGWDNLPSW